MAQLALLGGHNADDLQPLIELYLSCGSREAPRYRGPQEFRERDGGAATTL